MKLKTCLQRIPRPVRACAWVLLALIVAAAYYIALGCPTLTFEQEFRRAEKSQLVGPSQIVDWVPATEYYEFETMLVGETEHGITFFGRYGTSRSGGKHSGTRHYRFSYQEKTGDVTFAAPPNIFGIHGIYKLPVYIFTEHDDAVRAAITITASGSRAYTVDDKKVEDPFNVTFQSEAERDKNGFFRFFLTAQYNYSSSDPFDRDNDDAYALFCLSNLSSHNAIYDSQQALVIPITVTLFDADGNEILTRELSLAPYEGATQA